MSGALPTSPAPERVRIKSYTPTFVSTAHSLKRDARSRGAQRWHLIAEYPEHMTCAELAPIFAFLVKQRGQYETFTFTPPVFEDARGIATGTPLVDGASQTGRSIATKGWTASQTGILAAGDFVKFAGDDKVYMQVDDVNSDGSGDATLTIEPALITSPADEAAITVDDVSFTVSLLTDIAELDFIGPLGGPIVVEMVEAV